MTRERKLSNLKHVQTCLYYTLSYSIICSAFQIPETQVYIPTIFGHFFFEPQFHTVYLSI